MIRVPLPPGTVLYFACKAVPGAAALGGVVVFIRYGGPSTYGVYSVAYASAAFTTNLGVGWLLQATLRFAGDRSASWDLVHRWSVWVSILAVGTATVAISAATLRHAGAEVSVGAGLLAAAIATQGLIVTLMQSELAPRTVLFAEMMRATLQLLLPVAALVLIARSGSVLLFAMATATALAILPFHRRLRASGRSGDHAVLRLWWSYGWPMSLWLSLASMLQYADRVLLAHWRGTSEAGSYAGVYDVLNGGLAVCLFPVTMAAFPVISRAWNSGDRAGALRVNRLAVRVQIIIFIPVLVLVALCRTTFTRLLLDTTAPRAVDTVIPILLGAFCWQLALSVHKRLELERRTRLMLLFALAATSSNILVNLLTINRYGAVAAAWATFGSAALYLALCVAWHWFRTDRRPVPPVPTPAPGTLVDEQVVPQ